MAEAILIGRLVWFPGTAAQGSHVSPWLKKVFPANE